MKKKIIGILVCTLFVVSGFVSVTTATSIDSNDQLNYNDPTEYGEGPLTVRVEAEKMGYRNWEISVFLKNTWTEEIHVEAPRMGDGALSFDIHTSGGTTMETCVYDSDWPPSKPYPDIDETFAAGEEKLMIKQKWRGMANDPMWLSMGRPIILPRGKYDIQADIQDYQINSEDREYSAESEVVSINLRGPKSVDSDKQQPVSSPSLFTQLVQRLSGRLSDTQIATRTMPMFSTLIIQLQWCWL